MAINFDGLAADKMKVNRKGCGLIFGKHFMSQLKKIGKIAVH